MFYAFFLYQLITLRVYLKNPIMIGAVLRSNVIVKFSPQTRRISDVFIFLNFKGEELLYFDGYVADFKV